MSKYKIKYKGLDDEDYDIKTITEFMKTKGWNRVDGGGFTILFFIQKNVVLQDNDTYEAIEVDIKNKTVYYGFHVFINEDEGFDDLGVLLDFTDMTFLQFFDRLGYDLHPHNKKETEQEISDWFGVIE